MYLTHRNFQKFGNFSSPEIPMMREILREYAKGRWGTPYEIDGFISLSIFIEYKVLG